MTAAELPLGREVAYPAHYDPGLLFPIARSIGRSALGLAGSLPFIGVDRWHAYELSWLDARGKPRVATATFTVPFDSPSLIESKSLKLYLNSFNAHRVANELGLRDLIVADLSRAAGAPVRFDFGLPPVDTGTGDDRSIDAIELDIDRYGPPDPSQLHSGGEEVTEVLVSGLLKSNCPVTGQPDWAEVRIDYRGRRIDHEGLLRYLVSFRDHAEFHEQCVERLFVDVMAHCRPERLSIEARYTRRGGLDINPWRGSPGLAPPAAVRAERQ